MPIFEYICWDCEEKHEIIESISDMENKAHFCPNPKCMKDMHKIPPTSFSFKLKYNPRTDLVDWNGNKTKYWDDYKKQKAEGKNVVMPDGY